MSWRSLLTVAICIGGLSLCVADDPVFSGPQVGESLVPFHVVPVYGEDAGKDHLFANRPIEPAGAITFISPDGRIP